ncbi:MAG: MotA/TolQ/ExbB proton channel family protein [Phycisphaeraceae bacterium]
MYFKFPCQNCGKKLKADDEHTGRKARCPYCRTTQVIPDPPREEDESASSANELLSSLDALDQGASPDAAQQGGSPAAASAPRAGASQAADDASHKTKHEGKHDSSDSSTDVSALKSGLIGVGLTVAVYAVLFPLRDSVGVLFYGRGWVPVVITLLSCWAVGILILKYGKLRRQRESMLFDVLPSEIGEEITAQNLPTFIKHVRDLPMDPGRSFLISRVHRGLDHFRVRRNISEVGEMLQSQSDIDHNAVSSSYSLPNVFLWAIPILGFIGTVLGISIAVANFAGSMDATGDLEGMKESLGFVMGGLGTAFDTTLLALCMAVLLIFPIKSMQKAEEDLLDWVDEYVNENLLKRLQDGSGGTGSESQKAILKTINNAMADHHAELRAWREKLEAIGETFKQRASEEWTEIHQRLMEEHEQREKALAEAVDQATQKQVETAESLAEKHQTLMEQLGKLQEQTAQLQQEQSGQVRNVHAEVAEAVREAAQSLNNHVTGMQEGMRSLNEVLSDLNGKTVTIETRPRGWLFGRRKNGARVDG